ncbi:MAG TPA: hypothetical protein VMH87_11685 [Pseudomonadales bacterium]|nr:hypothetical protein [Pseudomonadales bacterium]
MSFGFPDHMQIKVTLPRDEKGLTTRECPKCKKIFKVKMGTGLSGVNLPCHCAYCGYTAESSRFNTLDQIAYARSVAMRQFGEMLHDELKKLEFETRGPMGLHISMKLQPHSPEPIHYYYEKKLETDVICDQCTLVYAIYGEFAYCPDCGSHNSVIILQKNIEFVEKMIELAEAQEPAMAQRLIGDALENLVSTFDGFGREVCKVAAPKASNPAEANDIRFQNLIGAQNRIQKLFNTNLQSSVSPDDWQFICRCFQKRHLLAHKMGVVDSEYIQATKDSSAVIGRKISIHSDEVRRLGALLRDLGTKFSKQLL